MRPTKRNLLVFIGGWVGVCHFSFESFLLIFKWTFPNTRQNPHQLPFDLLWLTFEIIIRSFVWTCRKLWGLWPQGFKISPLLNTMLDEWNPLNYMSAPFMNKMITNQLLLMTNNCICSKWLSDHLFYQKNLKRKYSPHCYTPNPLILPISNGFVLNLARIC